MIERWPRMVEEEHAQSDRARGALPKRADHWSPFAARFRPEARDNDGPLIDQLAAELRPDWTLLDVGAGGGRLAVPLSRRCRSVTCVEPSESMGDTLLKAVEAAGARNVTLVRSTWEDAEVAPQDAVLCSDVLYTVRDIGGFTRKLTGHARHRVLVVLNKRQPHLAVIARFWERVHGETRLPLPALPEFLAVLRELGIAPRVAPLPVQQAQSFASLDEVREVLRLRLFSAAGTPEDERLAKAMPELLVQRDGRWRVAGVGPRQPSLVVWEGTAG